MFDPWRGGRVGVVCINGNIHETRINGSLGGNAPYVGGY